jgi:hypothetical protein
MRPLRPLLLAALAASSAHAEPPADPRGIPADAPRAHQRLDPEPPPAAPADTPADPGTPLPPNPPLDLPSSRRLERPVQPAPASPAVFNPDPGSPPPTPAPPPAPFFRDDPSAPAAPAPPAPPYPESTYRPRLVAEPAPAADPNPDLEGFRTGTDLPRTGVRSTDYIPAHHGHGWDAPDTYPLAERGEGYPAHTEPAPDRWRAEHAGFTPWRRYTAGDTNESPFAHPEPELWHWYRQSLLKGDRPLLGQEWFLFLAASSETVLEDRDLPLPSGNSASAPGQFDFLGSYGTTLFVQNLAIDAVLLQGETVYKPPHQTFRLRLVANYNRAETDQTGILQPDPAFPSGGNDSPTRRTDTWLALQEAFYEYHLADLSPNYDFIALKAGIQTFNTDFRGLIFNDTQLGLRLLGNHDNNRLQYNAALFSLLEKDTNSELNTLDGRDQLVAVANLYRQDFLVKGYTAQLSLHGNFDHGARQPYYDTNGGIVRPAPLGTVAPHDVDVGYLGWAGDGHLHRLNLNHALYYAFGRDELNGLAGRPVTISAALAALELSYDQNWIRYKASALYATGDSDAEDGRATGFDSIVDNTNFIGGPFSYYVRQGFNLAGTAVAAKQRFSVLPNLRTSKTQGQANFVNPGVLLLGLGTDLELTPRLRAFVNANHIRFAQTESLQTALLTNQVDSDFGLDLSLGFQWRPLLTDNIILSAGYALFLPGRGFDDIYRNTVPLVPGFGSSPAPDDRLHSATLAITLTY